MTAWLRDENRAALWAIWPKCRLAEYFDIENMVDDGSCDDFEADLNMAALAYIEWQTPTATVALRMWGEQSVTEQIIEHVKDWLPDEAEAGEVGSRNGEGGTA